MKITQLAPENRPRERLTTYGTEALSSAELLAIILKSGSKEHSVLELSQEIMAQQGLQHLSSSTYAELRKHKGIGHAKACQLLAVFELAHRLTLCREKKKITSAATIAEIYSPQLSPKKQEYVIAVYLDTKNNIITDKTITIGTLNSSLIHPREIFHGAIKHLANSIILLHNHPSGDPTPSEEDLTITTTLQQTGEIMGIQFLDHIIIGSNSWWSWRESGV